ncbi:DUF1294 domain-containing protein [Catenovulum maritimum]|uniref:DNA-binding protein n=1 Tax=Catenovulum maritimum TaxID=1513271 RepID=A0A0J8GQC0_9ALTE|nr:DUF1294 domain-containing protein [Catenovulum maritimum]KMT64937.1 hypothetical protein XM47_12070 [Catenovulum maritimum]
MFELDWFELLMRFPHNFLIYLALINFITFWVYAWDKSAAIRGVSRVAEKRLHKLSLAGGWLGAFSAQRLFRHKTLKSKFQLIFWLTVLGNLSLIAACGFIFERFFGGN